LPEKSARMKKEDFECAIDEHELFFYNNLPECKKRQFAALEAMKLGYNGVTKIAKKYKIHKHTIRKGKRELMDKIVPPVGKIRQKGGGRKKNFCCERID
jgi:DNA invertase Pin-like site-specific DNA recombinase